MCGFAGILNNRFPLTYSQMEEIRRKVSFRGPDSNAVKLYDSNLRPDLQGHTAFFFSRLAIIDLDQRSDQPFEDQRYTFIFNGEIYNYQSLRKEL